MHFTYIQARIESEGIDPILNNQSKTIKNNSLPGPIYLLKQAWKIYKRNFKTLAIISLITYLSSLVPSILSFLGGISFKSSPALYVSITIVTIAISFWGVVAMLYVIKDEKNEINIKESLIKGWKKLFPYVWVLFLSVFIMSGGFFLLLIPGILFSIWFSMGSFVLVVENVGGMNVLLTSKEYVRGYFWAVTGRILLSWIIYIIVFWMPTYLFKLLNLSSYIVSIYSAIGSMIGGTFYLIYGFLLYRHLRSIKGEITLSPSPRNKVFFILYGILGFMIPIILIIMYLWVIPSSFYISRRNPMTQFNYKLDESSLVVNRKSVQTALEEYYSDRGLYPSSLEDLVPKYLSSVPLNPITKTQFNYVFQENGKKYRLCLDKSQAICVFSGR